MLNRLAKYFDAATVRDLGPLLKFNDFASVQASLHRLDTDKIIVLVVAELRLVLNDKIVVRLA